MKKFLFGILFLILLGGGFFIYQFGSDFGLSFGGKKLEAKTYGEIKEDFEKDPKNISIEDAYLLAKNEDDEKYYRALYEAYKKEDKDLGLQYLYNEFVMNNNKKVYPILKEEAKSDVTFTATETGYLGAARNSFYDIDYKAQPEYSYDYLFVPKFYDSKTKDEFVYGFKAFKFPYEPIDYTDDSYISPELKINFIDSNGVKHLGGSPSGYQAGQEKIFFKNFDGKTVLALSMTDFAPKMAMEGFIPQIQQVYIYKDYSMTSTLVTQVGEGTEYRSWGIGSYSPFGDVDEIHYYKGDNEISKEEFEKNVVPINKLINLSKKDSKSWIKVKTSNMHDLDFELEQNIVNNLFLYTYNISLSEDVNLAYLRPYLKHIYTVDNSNFLLKYKENNEKIFFANIYDLDKDGYPEILLNYILYRYPFFECHSKIIAYDPEKKSTYGLCDFVNYQIMDAGGAETNNGGIYEKDGQRYFALYAEIGGEGGYEQAFTLYKKEGTKLKYIDSSVRQDSEIYPSKKSGDGFNEDTIIYPDVNSKDKYENFYNSIISKEARDKIVDDSSITYSYKLKNIIDPFYLTDIDEIKDILLANKMLSLPSYKRLAIGEKYYPKEVILIEDGKTYVDISVLKDIKGLKVNKDEANILEKDKNKYIDLQDLIKLDLVTSENQDLVRLKEKL